MRDTRRSVMRLVGVCLVGLLFIGGGILAEVVWGASRVLGFSSGLGTGVIAVGVFYTYRALRRPEKAREQEINEKDERHIRIREKFAYSTYFVTLAALLAAEFILLFTDQITACLIILAVMLIHTISLLCFLGRYSKRM